MRARRVGRQCPQLQDLAPVVLSKARQAACFGAQLVIAIRAGRGQKRLKSVLLLLVLSDTLPTSALTSKLGLVYASRVTIRDGGDAACAVCGRFWLAFSNNLEARLA